MEEWEEFKFGALKMNDYILRSQALNIFVDEGKLKIICKRKNKKI